MPPVDDLRRLALLTEIENLETVRGEAVLRLKAYKDRHRALLAEIAERQAALRAELQGRDKHQNLLYSAHDGPKVTVPTTRIIRQQRK